MASIIPVREHSEYALLWDLAREMVKLDDRTAEECWLAIMDAFWVGKLRELFVFGPRKGGERGRVLLQLPARSTALAAAPLMQARAEARWHP
jgi:hypothetical protein